MIHEHDYGRALFELASEQGKEADILNEISQVEAIFEQEPTYVTLLDSHSLPKLQRLAFLDDAFKSLSPYHLNFLKILCEKHAIKQYAACAKTYGDLYDKAHNILRATALTAIPMNDSQKKLLTEKLSSMTKKQVVLTNEIDSQIMGGITLRFGGVQLDDSVRSRLDDLRRSLAGVIV